MLVAFGVGLVRFCRRPVLRQKLGGPPEAATKKLAIALLLHGDTEAALSGLDLFAASIADRTDLAANDFRAFDQALRRFTAAY